MMNRKHFLKVMGTGLAGVAAGSALAACGGSDSGAGSGGFQKNWAWMRGNLNEGETWQSLFATMKEGGIDGLLLQQEDPQTLREDVIPAAQAVGLDLHIWIQTMMRGENVEAHPDWYAVNRNGVSTAEDPPYVDYYHFMSPCVEDVRDYLANHVDTLAQIAAAAVRSRAGSGVSRVRLWLPPRVPRAVRKRHRHRSHGTG
jgi:hypothetical protein